MAKKPVNLNLDVAEKALKGDFDDDDFVHGAKTSKRQNVAKKIEKRRMTVYLPEDVAVALELHSVKAKESVSGLMEIAVRRLLKEGKGTR